MDKNDILTFAKLTLEGVAKQPDRMKVTYIAERMQTLLKQQSGMRRSDQMVIVITLGVDGTVEEVISNIPLLRNALCVVVQDEDLVSSGSYAANFQVMGLDKVVTDVRSIGHQSNLESEVDAARELLDSRN